MSRRFTSAQPSALATIACAMACASMIGCGSVGEPLYPVLNIPSRVTDLAAVERGDKMAVTFTIPPLTTEGMKLETIGSVELRIGPNPDEDGFNPDRWAASATRVDVPAPSHPGQVVVSAPIRDWVGKEVFIGVRILNARGRPSAWSTFLPRTVQPPLAMPTDFRATPVAEGVRLEWKAPSESKFRIYRTTGDQQTPAELATVETSEYVDGTSEYGKAYAYYVQGVNGDAESDAASLPNPVTPVDTFAPATPTNVTASTGIGAIELGWERAAERDFKEYRVYRSTDEGRFEKIAEGLEGPNYSDSKVEPGKRYRYRITALDQVGNESEPSVIVEAAAP